MKLNIGKYDSAYDTIVDTYDIETLNEIVNHGCVSGVAHDHIYTRDCVDFFDTYEDEILDYIETNVGEDVLPDLFLDANCDIDSYKNNVTWCYIELVAMRIVDTTNEVESDAELVLT
tara:strand:+ start:223 stop:573 length:351 start_codon:yes stop_codon:yes gene_type:complete